MIATHWRGCTPARCRPAATGGAGVGELAVAVGQLGLALIGCRQRRCVRSGWACRCQSSASSRVCACARDSWASDPSSGIGAAVGGVPAAGCTTEAPAGAGLARCAACSRSADRLGALQRVVGQPDAEGLLDAQQQFGARQAVEAEVAVEHAVQASPPAGPARRPATRAACPRPAPAMVRPSRAARELTTDPRRGPAEPPAHLSSPRDREFVDHVALAGVDRCNLLQIGAASPMRLQICFHDVPLHRRTLIDKLRRRRHGAHPWQRHRPSML